MPEDPHLHSIQPSPDDPDTPRPVSPPVLEEDRLRTLVSQSEEDDGVGGALKMGCFLGLCFGMLLGLGIGMWDNALSGLGQDVYSPLSRSRFDEVVRFLICGVVGGGLGALIGGAVFFFAGVLLSALRRPFRR